MSENKNEKIRVGIVGAKALTAGVLIEMLLRHPNVELTHLAGRDEEATPLTPFFPYLRGRLDGLPCGADIQPYDADAVAKSCDAAFLCLPHKTAAGIAGELLSRDVRVFDLSADFRFDDLAQYEATYKVDHPHPELNGDAPYALAEWAGDALAGKRLMAIPGCYPTSVLVPLMPLAKAGLIDLGTTIIADSKSGVSGAGRSANDVTHYCNANESMKAYAVGTHRHGPEIREKLALAAGGATDAISLVFTPHLAPMERGILSTIYVKPAKPEIDAAAMRRAWEDFYADWPLVRVLAAGELPATSAVARSGFCDIAAFDDATSDTIVLVAAIDNLMKGASSQALQAFNLSHGLPDARGILPGV